MAEDTVAKRRKLSPGRRPGPSTKVATLAIHGGDQKDLVHGAIIPPITTATSFIAPGFGEEGRFCYSRVANPTRHALETALAALEGGVFCAATASGMAATSLALELLEHGSHVVVMNGVYGGTRRLFERVRRQSMGLDFTYADLNDVEHVRQCMRDNTRMVWLESPTNPMLELVDIVALVKVVKSRSPTTLICADNTFATAWNQRPLELGADLVMLSSSKYIGGHSDMIGGALIARDQSVADRVKFLASAVGAIASPFDAYLALRGLKTLAVRMERQCASAFRIARFLEGHPRVEEVRYPLLESNPQRELCKRQMRSGGAVVTARLGGVRVAVGGDADAKRNADTAFIKKFIARLRYWVLAESLGGVESMVNHSATMSHASMTREERASVGVYDTTLRFSVGLEDVDDLIEDLDFALHDDVTPSV